MGIKMKKENINLVKHKLYQTLNENQQNFVLKTVLFEKFKSKCKAEYNLLKKNEAFRNIHNGKRCFIIGNGPSLKDIEFPLLENEYVFTVNHIMKMSDFRTLHTNYHLWSDPDFFNGNFGTTEILGEFRKMNRESGVTCFMPLYAYDFINKNCLEQEMDIHYFRNVYFFTKELEITSDITKNLPVFRTVVQYAILIAIFMGFKEIYLLGCDATGILVVLNTMLDKHMENMHAYDEKQDNIVKFIKQSKCSTEYVCYTQYLTFLAWRKLFEYAKVNGVLLKNCSNNSLIDSIPFVPFQTVINNNSERQVAPSK